MCNLLYWTFHPKRQNFRQLLEISVLSQPNCQSKYQTNNSTLILLSISTNIIHTVKTLNVFSFKHFNTNQSPIETRWSISKSFYRLKNTAADTSHSKCTTTIINNAVRTWFTCVFFHRLCVFCVCICMSVWNRKLNYI